MVIAIDGPGGVGKSTVASTVARRLQLPHLDTGATYRAATAAVLTRGVHPTDAAAVVEVVSSVAIGYEDGVVTVDGEDVTRAVRGGDVTAAVSEIAANAAVRRILVEFQRRWVERHGGSGVVEGRDIGSTVFPDAAVKVFLTADAEIRALRRAGDSEAVGRTTAEIAGDLARRDAIDSEREASPLRPAPGAVVIDTTHLTIEQVVAQVLSLVEAA